MSAAKKKVTRKKKAVPVKDWRPPQQRLTKRQMRDFLINLAEHGNVSYACRVTGAKRTAIYKRARTDEAFAKAFEEAKEIGWNGLEDDTLELAREGYEEPVFHQGEIVGTKQKYSPALNIFLLKAHNPERYRERVDIEHGNKGGGPLTMNVVLDPQALAEAANNE